MPENVPLTPSENPALTDSGPTPRIAGDHQDDDGRYIDDTFEAADHSPVVMVEVPVERTTLPTTNKILRARLRMAPCPEQAVMLLPADPYRKSIQILAGTSFSFAGEPYSIVPFVNVGSNTPPAVLFDNDSNTYQTIVLDGYTGALYVTGTVIGNAVNVDVFAITE